MTNSESLLQAWLGLQRRAEIFEYPVREMQKRGWISDTDDTDELEDEMCRFFSVSRLREVSMENFSVKVGK